MLCSNGLPVLEHSVSTAQKEAMIKFHSSQN